MAFKKTLRVKKNLEVENSGVSREYTGREWQRVTLADTSRLLFSRGMALGPVAERGCRGSGVGVGRRATGDGRPTTTQLIFRNYFTYISLQYRQIER